MRDYKVFDNTCVPKLSAQVKWIIIPKNRQAASAMNKFLSNDDQEGIQRMINKGTLLILK